MAKLKHNNGLKHVMILPEEKYATNNDLALCMQKTSTPDLTNYLDKSNFISERSKIIKIRKPSINKINNNNNNNNETNIHNSKNLVSSSYLKVNSTRIKSGSKTRVLVQKENQIRMQNDPLLNPFTTSQTDSRLDNFKIQQHIIGSMRYYGNFINNPLTSNQYLVNPIYNQNLLLMRNRKHFYSPVNSPGTETDENQTFKKTNETKNQEQQQQENVFIKTTPLYNNDFSSSSNKFVNAATSSTSSLKQARPQSVKHLNKKVCFSDLNDKLEKEEIMKFKSSTTTSTENIYNSISKNNIISKNIFLNYKPQEVDTTFLNNILSNNDKKFIKRNSLSSSGILNKNINNHFQNRAKSAVGNK